MSVSNKELLALMDYADSQLDARSEAAAEAQGDDAKIAAEVAAEAEVGASQALKSRTEATAQDKPREWKPK